MLTLKRVFSFLLLLCAIGVASHAAETTLASWTFDKAYDASTTSGVITYTPNASESTDVTKWFNDGTPNILPNEFIGTQTDYSLSALSTGRYMQFCNGHQTRVFRIENTTANAITDFTDGSQHNVYYEVSFPATGYKRLKVNFALAYGGNAVVPMHVVYSTDNGATWTAAGTYNTASNWYTYDAQSAVIPASNEANVKVRIIADNDFASNWNLKYINVTGSSIADEIAWNAIKMDFTTEGSFIRDVTTTQWESFTTGIAVDGEGNGSAVATAAATSVGTLAAQYFDSQWGTSSPKFTVDVNGPVTIKLGSSYYDKKVTVKKNGEVIKVLDSNIPNKLWSRSAPDCVTYTYTGGEATLTIESNGYCPYISVENYTMPAAAPVNVAIGSALYSTFSAPFATTIPAGVKAYAVTVKDGSTVTLTEIKDGVVPAMTGVVIAAEAAGPYTFNPTAEAGTAESVLKAVIADEMLESTDYVLGNGSEGVGFYNLTKGKKVDGNKAYLPTSAIPSGAKFVGCIFADDVTAAEAIVEDKAVAKAVKFLQKGQLVIKTANGFVNAAGAQVK